MKQEGGCSAIARGNEDPLLAESEAKFNLDLGRSYRVFNVVDSFVQIHISYIKFSSDTQELQLIE